MKSAALVVALALASATLSSQTPQQPPAPAPGVTPAPAGRGRGGPPARIVSFEAKPASIKPGESALLVWHVENPTATAIEPGVGRVIPRGTVRVTPSATTTYTLTNGTATSTVTVTVAGTKPLATAATVSGPTPRPIARMADGKPDFSGVYGFGGGGGRGAGRGGAGGPAPAGPVLKAGAEKYRVNRAANPQDTGRTADCMPLIPPDAFGVPYEFQIVQSKDYVVIFHEYPGTFRIVPLDGQRTQLEPDPTWLGDSIGRWDGDTLVIDTIGYNDKTEIGGYRHTEALHTVERLARTEDGFSYEITIEDPHVFEKPWTQSRAFRFSVPPMKKIFEFVCENNRDYRPLFGPQQAK